MIRPVDIAALNLLTEHDNVVTYINALMQVEPPSKITKKNSGSQHQKTWKHKRTLTDTETIFKRTREVAELVKFDPTEIEESRKRFLSMF